MSLDLNFILIPAGEFTMGTDRRQEPGADPDEFPTHQLVISDFYIMRGAVTNAQYQQFMKDTGYRAPQFWKNGSFAAGQADHPVVGVSFGDAVEFCLWAAQASGLPVRLPSEAEWEKAARGSDGRTYPWGNHWEAGRANTYEARLKGTSPVGQFSPAGDSPYGVADLAGNVQEWCATIFDAYPYDPNDGRDRYLYDLGGHGLLPKQYDAGCTSVITSAEAELGKSVVRGGSWRESKHQSRCAYRSWAAPLHRSDDTGFRCAYEPVIVG